MAREKEVVEAIGRHLEEIKGKLGDRAPDFQARYEALRDLAKEESATAEAIGKLINSLYAEFPEVETFLKENVGHLFTDPASQGTGEATAQGTQTASTGGATNTQGTSSSSTGGAATTSQPSGEGGGAPGGAAGTGGAGTTDGAATTPPPQESNGLQYLKERVSSILALLVVGFTLGIACYGVVIHNTDFQNFKDILTMLLGPFGSVLGYYFGRLPADARAAQAQQQAAEAQKEAGQAEAHADQVTDRALKMGETANEVAEEVKKPAAKRRRAAHGEVESYEEDEALINEKVQRLRAETMELLKLARRR